MRFKSRGAFLALMTTLALSAVVVSSAAAALPEFQKEGKPLTEAIKFTATGGESEWQFKESSSSGHSSSFAGEIKGPSSISGVTITFKGMGDGGQPCSNVVEVEKFDLVTKELKGTLGYINKAKTQVGELLEPVSQPFANCKWRQFVGPMNGSLLGAIKPVNKAATKFTITYKQTKAEQELTQFEGSEVLHELEVNDDGPSEKIGVGTEFELTTAKAIEIKA